jgi:CPA1 family monovalent cation:H+ antiporter
VVSWAGTRGVVPLAAALSIPLTTDSGAPLPQRDLLLVLAVTVIVISLIVQGLTLEPLVRRTAVVQPVASAQQEEAAARLWLAEAGIARLDELAASEEVPDVEIDRIRRALNAHIGHARARLRQDADAAQDARSGRDIHRDVISAENVELASLYAAGTIGAATRQRLQHALDLELARLEAKKQADRWTVARALLRLLFLALVRVRFSIVVGVPGSLVGDVREFGACRLGGTPWCRA